MEHSLGIVALIIVASIVVMSATYAKDIPHILLVAFGIRAWAKKPAARQLVTAVLGFGGGALFHGGIAVGLLFFLALLVVDRARQMVLSILRGRLGVKSLAITAIGLFPVALYAAGVFPIPKLGYVYEINIERIIGQARVATREGAAWPE